MKINWINQFDAMGNSIGYATHQKNIEAALNDLGIIDKNDFDIALHCCPVPHYNKMPGKINVLYTMYECTEIPVNWIRNLQDVDLIITPCSQNKELFEQYTDIPIAVVLEGCNENYFKFIDREFPKDKPFTFVWSAANNLRKGYVPLLNAWAPFHRQNPNTQLIIKTLPNWPGTKQQVLYYEGGNEDGIILDNRKLPLKKTDELPALYDVYKYANAFLMPSMGEGFCLPIVEALSTGLPCVYTPWSGPVDYMEDFGYPADYIMVPVQIKERFQPEGNLRIFISRAAYTLPQSIYDQMMHIYHNYDEALKKAKAGSEMVRKKLTWKVSAKNLVKTLEDFINGNIRS